MSASRECSNRLRSSVVCRAGVGVVMASLAVVLMPSPARSASPGANGLIAFAKEFAVADGSPNLELMLLDPATGRQRNLTSSGLVQGDPAWSPDGRRVAYSGDGYLAYITLRGYIRPLVRDFVADGTTLYPWQPSWSPDGTRLAFVVYDEAGRTGIAVSKPGGRPRVVVPLVQDLTMNPHWSPDGRRIAFERYYGPYDGVNFLEADVMTVRTDGTGVRNLTPDSLKDHRPSWSPDGDLIFISRRGCTVASAHACEEVYVMEPDGSDARSLTQGPHDWGDDGEIDRIGQAEISPEGDALLVSISPRAFTNYNASSAELWRVDLVNGVKTRLLDSFYFWFDWQPRCTVRGTPQDDVLVGTAGKDLICGLAGDDVIKGLGGGDVLFGHGGDDRVVGGTGRDIVVGNSGRDRCDSDPEDLSRVC